MDLSGTSKVYRWKNALTQFANMITDINSDQLEILFDILADVDGGKAEGLELFNS